MYRPYMRIVTFFPKIVTFLNTSSGIPVFSSSMLFHQTAENMLACKSAGAPYRLPVRHAVGGSPMHGAQASEIIE
jgi:hypothetical protein